MFFTRISSIRDWILSLADARLPITLANPIPNQTAHYLWDFSFTFPVNTFVHPDPVVPLLVRVKEYERLTVRAALAPSLDGASEALAHNPLVPDRATAGALVRDLSPLW